MSGPKRWWPDLIHRCLPLARQRATSDPSPLSSPVHDNPFPTEVVSNQAIPTPTVAPLPIITRVPQVAQVEASPAISALKTVLGRLRDSLTELPPLQVAIGVLLECVVYSEGEGQNRQAFDELASDLANLAALLQKHVVESRPHEGPYSIANVERAIGEQTQLIKVQQERSRIGRLATAREDEEAILKCYRRIGALFQQLQADILLSVWDDSKEREIDMRLKDLSPADDAYHDAALPTSVTKRVRCTQDTRVELLKTTYGWACDENTTRIYWLNGMAGTGKTTIAYTLCEMLKEAKQLGASFFCSRNSPDCRNVNKIVPTIAYQLGRYSNSFRRALCDVLRSDPDASKRHICAQFECLIAKPFAKMGHAMPKDVVVVIDALDECTQETGTKEVLRLLMRHAGNLPIKFFVASRPEPAISEVMEARAGASRSILRLHEIEKSLVQADITVYLTEALEPIQVSSCEIEQLAARAGNLFIFAATAVRYILPDNGSVNRRERLLEVLALQPNQKNGSHQGIDDLYARILATALDEKIYKEAELTTRRRVLWTAICAMEALTIPALTEILHISNEENVRVAIQPLRSVLHISDSSNVVSPLHASFPDFLLAEERAGRFHCDSVLQSTYLAECCFELMRRLLQFNICGLESSCALDVDVSEIQSRVDDAISSGLFYSCRYWGDHLTRGPPSHTSLSLLGSFIQYHLLFWIEVLNLKSQIGHGEVMLSRVLAWLPVENEWSELRDFTYDARNFLTSFAGNPTSLSTPHIYVSTLPFTSEESQVRATYWPRTRGLVEIEGAAAKGRGKSALATWNVGNRVLSIARSSDGRRVVSGSANSGVSVWDVPSGICTLGPLKGRGGEVKSVAFSPDNSRIASGSDTIHVWDASNGDLVIELLRSHNLQVYSVAFSPNGTRLASGLSDWTIRIWDVHTGAEIGDAYQGHQGAVLSVAFSADGTHLASGSEDCAVRVWNWWTGAATLGPMEGHTGWVRSVAYSPDGSRLASGSDDRTVRVWDMSSGTLLAGPIVGHTETVLSISFSPDGTQVVSSSLDRTIRLWQAESRNLLAGPLEGHGSSVSAVLFTTDGTRILSGSWDGTIRVWDARHRTTGATESPGHSDGIVSVAMSPDGTRAASGSLDNTICVWDTHTGALVAGPLSGHTGPIKSVTFSPDGARVVSGSEDHTLRTWDASTGASLAGPFEGHTNSVSSVAFSSDGSQVASGSYDCTIRLWDSHTGELVTTPIKGHTDTIRSIAFSPAGSRIVSGSWHHTVRMWDVSDGTVLWTSDAHTGVVRCVAFSPTGTCVVSGSYDKSILVLDAGNGAVLHGPFTGHTGEILSVVFSPNGTCVVSGSGDGTVRVWDVQSGAVVIGSLKGHTKSVNSVAFSPDGARILSGSYDGTIRFWDAATATQPDATSFDGWSIDADGWLIDSQSQRLFWVPPDVRDGFWFPTPSNPLASNSRCKTRVDNATLIGDRWHGSYDASLGSAPS